MSDAPSPMLFGDEHVRRYRETGGEVGHEWNGTRCLLLTTTGRKSGEARTAPLIYGVSGSDHVVVASKGGDDAHPAWYLNLVDHPEVEVQVGPEVFAATARTATAEEKATLWPLMVAEWADYDAYAARTDRDIPVVVLERTGG